MIQGELDKGSRRDGIMIQGELDKGSRRDGIRVQGELDKGSRRDGIMKMLKKEILNVKVEAKYIITFKINS